MTLLRRVWAKQPAAIVGLFTTIADALIVAYVSDDALATALVSVVTAFAGLFLHTQVTAASEARGKIDLRI